MPTLLLGAWFTWRLWRDYLEARFRPGAGAYLTWVALFFWSIITHPILDCFTNFGTQIWQPFSDVRCNRPRFLSSIRCTRFLWYFISHCLAPGTHYPPPLLTWAGILWSCGYLGYTYWHKQQANTLFEQALQSKNITTQRYMTGPTILNNILWYGMAEGDTAYYFSQAGFNDCQPAFRKISTLPKNHHLLDHIPKDDRALRFLRWFTNGYYDVMPYRGNTLQVNSTLRLFGDSLENKNYIFPFLLYKRPDGKWEVYQHNIPLAARRRGV